MSENKADLGINFRIFVRPLPCARHCSRCWRFNSEQDRESSRPPALDVSVRGRQAVVAHALILGPQET